MVQVFRGAVAACGHARGEGDLRAGWEEGWGGRGFQVERYARACDEWGEYVRQGARGIS